MIIVSVACSTPKDTPVEFSIPANVLDYTGVVHDPKDRDLLIFSDQGAWFGYSIPIKSAQQGGFLGPFLMTQENGRWLSPILSNLNIIDETGRQFDFSTSISEHRSFNSHLEKSHQGKALRVFQKLFFKDKDEAIILTEITNISDADKQLDITWNGMSFLEGIQMTKDGNAIRVSSEKSKAIGMVVGTDFSKAKMQVNDSSYQVQLLPIEISAGEKKEIVLVHRFSFDDEFVDQEPNVVQSKLAFEARRQEKERIFQSLVKQTDPRWKDSVYQVLVAKTALTLQNNWRSPAGELKFSGLFPSYHYIWFNGFWAWDSWKHATALAEFDPPLAKDQVRAMYHFMDGDGFIPDCVYRDTTIEAHNYRNTKPPLSGWAIWSIYQADNDLSFLEEMYPLLLVQHDWWYRFRDHDGDGLCEYGSTDGTLKAAKWDSGMDNAVRFDGSEIVNNSPGAYSLNQESVDLNAYLYQEKQIISQIAELLEKEEERDRFIEEAATLSLKIRNQFFDQKTGWFYDTNLKGDEFIKVMGCEGWIPLWAGVASKEQAKAVFINIMKASTFNTRMPLQTLSADHPKFKPDNGYWRGPNWLDQAYFGIMGLKNYGYTAESEMLTEKLFTNADGLLAKGPSIRENYQPLTGAGLESENFSWSAAHYLLLLLNK